MKKRILLLTSCLMLLLSSCSVVQQGASDIPDILSILTGHTEAESAAGSGSSETSAASQDSDSSSITDSASQEPANASYVELTDRYYYSLLNEEEQTLYRELYQSFLTLEEVTLSVSDPEEASRIMEYLRADCPELYLAIEGQYTTTSLAGKTLKLTITPSSALSVDEQESARQAVAAYVQDFLTTLTPEMTQWQQALAAYEYVILHAEYDESAPHNQTLYSAVLGRTVCRGYTTMFQYFCQNLGIPCILVSGTSSDGDSHAWNMVFLDGEWCGVDCTYGDSVILNTDVDYSWFGLTEEALERSRKPSDTLPLPPADSHINEFYVHKGRDYDSYDLDTILELADGISFFSFHYNNEAAYQEACHRLFDEKDLYKLPGHSFTYVTEDNTWTIYIRLE